VNKNHNLCELSTIIKARVLLCHFK